MADIIIAVVILCFEMSVDHGGIHEYINMRKMNILSGSYALSYIAIWKSADDCRIRKKASARLVL